MPELPVQEVRLSELHLPEIKRDEIVRSLSEVRVPTLDLAAIERPRIALPDSIRRFDWRSIDLGGALAGAAAIARLGRPLARRSRWPYVAGAADRRRGGERGHPGKPPGSGACRAGDP